MQLLLPVAKAPLLEPRRHPTVAPIESVTSASRLDGFSIIVVDDDAEACDALTKLLGSLGATLPAATSAQAVLGKLDGTRPDAIVADIAILVEDGFFFACEIRKQEQDGSSNWRALIAVNAYGRIVELAEISATKKSVRGARR